MIDWISCLFIRFVLLISSIVILYRIIYIENDKSLLRFIYLVVLFIISIILIILSPNLIRILIGWDLLGLVSYCLVIYYQNYYSYNSGIVTVLSNRIGDVGLLIRLGLILLHGRWNFFFLDYNYLLFLIILLAGITKRAQIPFSSWLPIAIAAPTPISSLVHSSTLVTAGVYLIIRFNKFIIISEVNYILLFLSLLTIIISGIQANFEFDLKKIIALSTLSQLGFIMIILSLGAWSLGFYHLLTHAIFKSLIFLCAGGIIHIIKGNQDIRYFGNLSKNIKFIIISFIISVFSLIGIPFLAGFYSKDLIIEIIYIININIFYLIFALFSLRLTIIYSLRLLYFIFFRFIKFNSSSILIYDSKLINISIIILIILRIISGRTLNWLFFFDIELIFLKFNYKFLVIIFIFIGILFFLIFMNLKFFFLKKFILFNISIWFLNFLYLRLNKLILFFRIKITLFDIEWLELLERKFLFKIKVSLKKNYYLKFKIYNIIFIQLFLIRLIIFFFILI